MTDKTNPELAEYAVLVEYDRTRSRLGHDYGSGQRGSELSRRRREGRFDVDAEIDPTAHVSGSDFAEAFERVGLPKMRRAESETFRRETPATKRTLKAWRMVGMLAEQKRQEAEREDEELADDVLPCGCSSGSCYCDGETPNTISGSGRASEERDRARLAGDLDVFFYALPPSSTEELLGMIESRP